MNTNEYYEEWSKLNAEADEKLMSFSYFVAGFSFLLGIFNNEYLLGTAVPISFLALLKITLTFLENRTLKTIIFSALWISWVGLFLVLTHGLTEMRFIYFIFLFVLVLYQNTLPLIAGGIVGTFFMGALYFTKYDESWLLGDFIKTYILEERGLTYERLNITMVAMFLGCVAAIWLAKLLGSKTNENILNNISNKEKEKLMLKNKAFAINISNGELHVDYQLEETDEMGKSLVEMRNNLAKSMEREKQEKFSSNGFAEMGEILRKHSNDIAAMSDEVLLYIVKYLKATQGGLFILQEFSNGERKLVLSSTYAYNRKKFLKKEVEIGEGLVGQCFLEEEYTYLTNIPENYTTITSGLGDAIPRSMLLIPLKSGEEMVGVIELASFNKFEMFEVEFLKKLGEDIASTILTVKTNERTTALLVESQNLTEEMNTQQEEMRQNMEEMEATQEEMRRMGIEMEGQVSAINTTMATVEFDLRGHILKANENFLRLMKYSLEEIKGKHHSMFVTEEERNSQEYAAFWDKLALGKSTDGEFTRINHEGEEVYIRGIYNPIFNTKGETVKILKLAYDVTEQKNLLQQSIIQLNKMRSQEEDLLQNYEELQATQEIMSSMTNEMEGQVKALNLTIATIEFDMEGNIIKANDIFLNLFGYSEEEIFGKHHSIFVDPQAAGTDEFQKLWDNLSQGNSVQDVFKRLSKEGKEIFIKGIYHPILNRDGEPIKIFKLAYDITDKVELEKKLGLIEK